MDKAIGEKLKKLRKENGFTIVTLAKELDISIGIISEWEHGRKHPRPGVRDKLCKLYGVSESVVFGSAPPPPSKRKTPKIETPATPQTPERKDDLIRTLDEELVVKKEEVRSKKQEKKGTPLSGFFKKFFK